MDTKNFETTMNRIGKSLSIAAKAMAEGAIGTVEAFAAATTETIIPATVSAVDEMKELFPDPGHPGSDPKLYSQSLKIAAKTGTQGVIGVVAACAAATTYAVIPAFTKGAKEINKVFSADEERQNEGGIKHMNNLIVKSEYNPEMKTMYYHIEPVAVHKLITTKEMNNAILSDFYAAVKWLLSRDYDEYYEEYSNTINPAQQNIFIPLRSYRVFKNGRYKSVKIF